MKTQNEVWEILDKLCKEHALVNEAITSKKGINADVIIDYARVSDNKFFRSDHYTIPMYLLRCLSVDTIDCIIIDIIKTLRSEG